MNTPARRRYAVLWLACVVIVGVPMVVLVSSIADPARFPPTHEIIVAVIVYSVPLVALLIVHGIVTGRLRWDWHW